MDDYSIPEDDTPPPRSSDGWYDTVKNSPDNELGVRRTMEVMAPDAAKALADVFRYGRQKLMGGRAQAFAAGGAVGAIPEGDEGLSDGPQIDWGSYLQGADAVSPQEWQQAASQFRGAGATGEWGADPTQPVQDPQERTRQIIMAGETEDDKWRRLQYARRNFDQARVHAAAAADAGDVANAAESANIAFNYYPGAESVRFAPDGAGQGLIAQIGRESVPVSGQQLRQIQFDQAFAKGVGPSLAQASQAAPQTTGTARPRPQQQPRGAGRERPAEDMWRAEAEELGIDPKLVAMSHRIFPFVGQNQQRLTWLSGQHQAGEQRSSMERRAEATAGSRVQAAQAGAQGRVQVQQLKGDAGLEREQARGQWQQELQKMKNAGSLQQLAANNAAAAQNAQLKGIWNTVARATSTPGIDMKQVVADLQSQGIDLPSLLSATHGAPQLADGQGPGAAAPAKPGQPGRPAQVKGTDGNTYHQWPDGKYRTRPPQ